MNLITMPFLKVYSHEIFRLCMPATVVVSGMGHFVPDLESYNSVTGMSQPLNFHMHHSQTYLDIKREIYMYQN